MAPPYYYSKPAAFKYIAGICLGWLLVAILVDHFVLRQMAPWYTRLFALENGKFSFAPFFRDFAQLSFTTFLLVPFLLSIVVLIALVARKKIKKTDALKSIIQLFWGLAIIIIAVVAGHIIYLLFSGIDWTFVKVITNFCDGYKIEGKIYLFNLYIVSIQSGVGALVGLLVGFYAYYKKGVLKILIEKAGLDLS
jgi:hypothetical protein